MSNSSARAGSSGGRPSFEEQVERRGAPRFQFVAVAEVSDLDGQVRFLAQISEISVKGCFLGTPNMFPEGTLVRLAISCDEGKFDTLGRVLYSEPQYGMGVAFTDTAPEQQRILEGWLAELVGMEIQKRPVIPKPAPQHQVGTARAATDPSRYRIAAAPPLTTGRPPRRRGRPPASHPSAPRTNAGASAATVRHDHGRVLPRYRFVATAEVFELGKEIRVSAQTADLSLKGCFLETPEPLPEEAIVHLKLHRQHSTFEVIGGVRHSQPGRGMGIVFIEAPPEQRKVLEGWLAELAAAGAELP